MTINLLKLPTKEAYRLCPKYGTPAEEELLGRLLALEEENEYLESLLLKFEEESVSSKLKIEELENDLLELRSRNREESHEKREDLLYNLLSL